MYLSVTFCMWDLGRARLGPFTDRRKGTTVIAIVRSPVMSACSSTRVSERKIDKEEIVDIDTTRKCRVTRFYF